MGGGGYLQVEHNLTIITLVKVDESLLDVLHALGRRVRPPQHSRHPSWGHPTHRRPRRRPRRRRHLGLTRHVRHVTISREVDVRGCGVGGGAHELLRRRHRRRRSHTPGARWRARRGGSRCASWCASWYASRGGLEAGVGGVEIGGRLHRDANAPPRPT